MESRSGGMAEAERWLSIAAKLLAARDLYGTRTFALRARESDPSYEGSSQILAIADTLIAGDSLASNRPDWYAVLQLPRSTSDQELVGTQYRKLHHLLDPARNKLAFADRALKLVSNAWSVLSDPAQKSRYDNELQNPVQLSENQPQPETPNQQRQPQTPLQQRKPHVPNLKRKSQTPYRQRKRQPQTVNQQQQPQMSVRRSLRKKDGDAAAEGPIVAQSTRPARKTRSAKAEIRLNQAASPESQPIGAAEPVSEVLIPIGNAEPVQEGPILAESSRPIRKTRSAKAEIWPNQPESQPIGDVEPVSEGANFWTACPYCYVMFEYPKVYEECALRCQNCRRAFHGVVITPPETATKGKDSYFCSWGFFPLGFSGDAKATGGSSNWSPVGALFACPLQGDRIPPANANVPLEKMCDGRPRKNANPDSYFQDDVFIGISDLSDDDSDGKDEDYDDDWERSNKRGGEDEDYDDEWDRGNDDEDYDDESERGGKRNNAKDGKGKGKGLVGRPPKNAQIERRFTRTSNILGGRSGNLNGPPVPQEGEMVVVHALLAGVDKNFVANSGKKKSAKVAKNLGKLDLNVEFSNDVEEPARGSEENGGRNREEDNMGGICFFEGLDEFLSSLPILSVAGDDKVKGS